MHNAENGLYTMQGHAIFNRTGFLPSQRTEKSSFLPVNTSTRNSALRGQLMGLKQCNLPLPGP